jgi:DNA invertase Pin-like site-specific DNA recombinase
VDKYHPDMVYEDKESGKDFNRAGYQQMLSALQPGDLVVVLSLDRLGRNYDEIGHQWEYITKTVGADIVVDDMPILDTRNRNDLTGTLIADIVLKLLSYVAETERRKIKERQAQGIAAMPIVNGKRVSLKTGRPVGRSKLDAEKISQIKKGVSWKELGISRATWYRYREELN